MKWRCKHCERLVPLSTLGPLKKGRHADYCPDCRAKRKQPAKATETETADAELPLFAQEAG